MAFPNEDKTATGKDGADITDANAKKEASYTVSPYLYTFKTTSYESWDIEEDVTYPYLPYIAFTPTPFPNEDKTATGKDGADITDANAKKEASYTVSPYLYTFKTTSYESWDIEEDVTYPYLPYIAPSVVGNLKYWNGSEWVIKKIKKWNGSIWVEYDLKRWNGVEWN